MASDLQQRGYQKTYVFFQMKSEVWLPGEFIGSRDRNRVCTDARPCLSFSSQRYPLICVFRECWRNLLQRSIQIMRYRVDLKDQAWPVCAADFDPRRPINFAWQPYLTFHLEKTLSFLISRRRSDRPFELNGTGFRESPNIRFFPVFRRTRCRFIGGRL